LYVPAEAKGPISSKNGSSRGKNDVSAISSRGKRGTKLRPWGVFTFEVYLFEMQLLIEKISSDQLFCGLCEPSGPKQPESE